jgi:stress response protein YsnF
VREAGISNDRIRIGASEGDETTSSTANSGSGLWDWLFGTDVPEADRRHYGAHFTEGGIALSVFIEGAPSVAHIKQVEDILERYHPIDLHVEEEEEDTDRMASGSPAAAALGTSTSAASALTVRHGREQVIPLPKEELHVGKRATDRVTKIRTYVVEEPVEKDVTLHDERIIVERRPATTGTVNAGAVVGREYEIREHHEEPVVQKKVRADEELVVHKEASDRTERVLDTVQKTKVDVNRATDVNRKGATPSR